MKEVRRKNKEKNIFLFYHFFLKSCKIFLSYPFAYLGCLSNSKWNKIIGEYEYYIVYLMEDKKSKIRKIESPKMKKLFFGWGKSSVVDIYKFTNHYKKIIIPMSKAIIVMFYSF